MALRVEPCGLPEEARGWSACSSFRAGVPIGSARGRWQKSFGAPSRGKEQPT